MIPKWNNKGKRKVMEALLKVGFRVLRLAKQRCAVDTGRLRASISISDSEGMISPVEVGVPPEDVITKPVEPFTVRVGTNVFYAEYVEFGTGRMRAQPFLRPALDEVRARFQ
jgi:HK97 gp10 family phage protein